MSDKYEIARHEARTGASIPLGEARVRPLYEQFLRALQCGEIPRNTRWSEYQKLHPDNEYAESWKAAKEAMF
jgi:hypothetical protein